MITIIFVIELSVFVKQKYRYERQFKIVDQQNCIGFFIYTGHC